MKKLLAPLVLSALLSIPIFAQNDRPKSSEADQTKHNQAIELLRLLNTAEVDYKIKHGSFADWETLVNSEEFKRYIEWTKKNKPEFSNIKDARGSDILPGWRLRLNLTNEGKGYDLMLEDVTDKKCGYAALTDERAIIRQSKAIDCEI